MSSQENSEDTCRICYESKNLISPCNCKGSSAYICRECWTQCRKECTVCGFSDLGFEVSSIFNIFALLSTIRIYASPYDETIVEFDNRIILRLPTPVYLGMCHTFLSMCIALLVIIFADDARNKSAPFSSEKFYGL